MADGIYPSSPIFVKPIQDSELDDERKFNVHEEAVIKDIERCFGVLQARFCIRRQEIFYLNVDDVAAIYECFVIIHNRIVRLSKSGMLTTEESQGVFDMVGDFHENSADGNSVEDV